MEIAKTFIYLFGSPFVEHEGKRIEFDTRKALAMLAYLITTGVPLQRDALATIFWPENDQSRARAALRRTLSVLRAGLPEDALLINREQIAFQPDHRVWCDVIEFQRLILRTAEFQKNQSQKSQLYIEVLEQAVSYYRGDFLAGFSLRDSLAFDNWQYLQSENYRSEFADTLQKLTDAYANRGDFQHAINAARRWLALDPLREEAHRQLMLCYAWSGQRGAALQQYRTCVRILEEELGVPPLEETTALYHSLLEQQPIPLPKVTAALESRFESSVIASDVSDPERGINFPLVGRSRETEILLRKYQNQAKLGHIVFIQGEPGIGKTRLAEEFLTFARNHGAKVLSARSYSGESSLAYAPFSDALRNATQRVNLDVILKDLPSNYRNEVLRLVPDLNPNQAHSLPAAGIEQPGVQIFLFEGIRQILLKILEGDRPGVFLLDDFHKADSASMQFLLYFIRRIKDHPVLILITCGDDSIPEPLNQAVIESQRAESSTLIELKRLNRAELFDLLRSYILPNVIDKENLADRIFKETEGLPFFVVEYIQSITKSEEYLGATVQEWPIPGGVQNLLRSRMKGLDETSMQILTTAAVIGRSFDFNTLVEASGRTEMETIAGLENLLAVRLIEEISGSEHSLPSVYDFTHDKLRKFVYEQTNLSRRRLLHRRIAEALSRQYRTKPATAAQISQIALHYELSGQEALAAENYKLAGDYARIIYAHNEAIHHYQSALALRHPDSAEIHETLGDLYLRMGEYNDANMNYQTAAAISMPAALARIEHKLGSLNHRIGNFELAICHYQSAQELIHGDQQTEELALIYADWSYTAYRVGERVLATEYARRSLELTSKAGSSRALMKAHNILGILARSTRDFQEAGSHLDSSLKAAIEINDLAGQAAALNNLALLAMDQQDYPIAIRRTQTALEICQRIGDRHQEAALLNHLSELYHLTGDEDEAMIYLKKAVLIFSEIGLKEEILAPEIWMLSEW